MPALIADVQDNSIAQELGIAQGDELLSVNGEKPNDLIDYKNSILSEEVTILIKKENGELEEIEIEKDFDEDLGLIFESAVFDKVKSCANNCIFCFVDQQPDGLRETLYIKDDDYRLSYLQGTYVTLTNLTKADMERIEKQKLGPLYVSIHTTNPKLRSEMLNNKRGGEILEQLRWLKSIDIPIHAQIVLCPRYNDGNELLRTLNDLIEFKSILLSVAVVPVGLTKFRKDALVPVDKRAAVQTVNIIDDFNRKIKGSIACASDEFFLISGLPVPPAEYYGNFAQLDDGVGALRLVLDDFEERKKSLPKKIKTPKTVDLVTSEAASLIFKDIIADLNKIENLSLRLRIIKSKFWGQNVNVTGLVVGQDIIGQLAQFKDEIEHIALPSVMLKSMSESFLDGLTLDDVKTALECKTDVIKDIYSTKDLIEICLTAVR